jgi:hypothetical protein
MTDDQLKALVASIRVDGWDIECAGRTVGIMPAEPVPDVYDPTHLLFHFGEGFKVPHAWTAEQVVRRIFAVLQFRTDHELRERFQVGDDRPFDAHWLGVTGEQHDWFVEAESAVRGF